jgi:excisionase family DNA binding protein
MVPSKWRRIRMQLFMPRGLSLSEAAYYVGLGETKFSQMVQDGRMPPPRAGDGRRLWCRYALDEAFEALPQVTKAPSNGGGNPWLSVKA